jgi:hypothetical protein
MYYSLTQKLMALPDDMVLFPGSNYAPLKKRPWPNRKDQSLPKIFLVETVPRGDGASLTAAD